MTGGRRRRRAALARRATVAGLALAVGTLSGCGSSARSPAGAPAGGVVRIVDGPPSRYDRITVSGNGRTSVVTGGLLADATPLLAARTFVAGQPLAAYGLDHPQATLTYTRAGQAVAVVALGSTDFDNHGVYAQRIGDPRVFLVLVSAAGPLLALVGITLPAPTD